MTSQSRCSRSDSFRLVWLGTSGSRLTGFCGLLVEEMWAGVPIGELSAEPWLLSVRPAAGNMLVSQPGCIGIPSPFKRAKF
jgi:hypothetical protein